MRRFAACCLDDDGDRRNNFTTPPLGLPGRRRPRPRLHRLGLRRPASVRRCAGFGGGPGPRRREGVGGQVPLPGARLLPRGGGARREGDDDLRDREQEEEEEEGFRRCFSLDGRERRGREPARCRRCSGRFLLGGCRFRSSFSAEEETVVVVVAALAIVKEVAEPAQEEDDERSRRHILFFSSVKNGSSSSSSRNNAAAAAALPEAKNALARLHGSL